MGEAWYRKFVSLKYIWAEAWSVKKEKLSGDEERNNKWSVEKRREIKKKFNWKTPQLIQWISERMAVIGVKGSVSFLPKNKSFEILFNLTERLAAC